MGRQKEGLHVTEGALTGLPQPVQRYMTYTGVLGKPWIRDVVLKQVGRFRQGLDRPWMPMTAVQTYTVSPPSFAWDARFRLMGLPLLRARDQYSSGRGHMYAKLAGLYTVFDVKGEELDQGAMLRYLSEMIWFPTAFLEENVSWRAVDGYSAEVEFSDAGKSVSGRLFFDDDGRPTNFTAKRYREIDGDFSLDDWSTPITGYEVRAGLQLPTRGKAVWNLPGGDFSYVDLEIEEVEYNAAA